jgi:hypothetical protein
MAGKFAGAGQGRVRTPAKTQAGGVPVINEPRCKVCQSPHRRLIDKMLVLGHTYSEIERNFEFAKIPRKSIALHKEKHLGYEDAGVRAIIESEAAAARENHEEGVSRIVTKQAYLKVALQKGYDAVLNDDTMVEPKDAVKIIELLQKMEEQTQSAAMDELHAQFQFFMQAVKEVVQQERWEEIVGRTAELLKGSGRDVEWTKTTAAGELEEVVDAEVVSPAIKE